MRKPGTPAFTLALVVSLAPALLIGQAALRRSGSLPPAGETASGPAAISGLASSARHCASGDASNVHALGWVDTGTTYTIRFDADFDIVAAVGRVNLAGNAATTSYGTPEFAFTASSPGTMALWMGGNGQAGCYRYQVEIRPPSASTAPAASAERVESVITQPSVEPVTADPLAITGLASSARHCISGAHVANVHEIGRLEQNKRVTLTFDSDFNPIAGVGLIDVASRSTVYYTNDDGGGSQQPRISFTAPHGGTLALYVAAAASTAGCYRYKVEIE